MASDGKVTISTALDNKGLEKGIGSISGSLGGLAKTVTKIATTITVAFATAAVAITKQATEAYAEYEQLAGGVETLFKDSASKVKAYADDAFYTAGVSANKYMETVTSFSASLISSLGGDTGKAADIANMAMIDMSDNANKMGTSLESIQNAYQGFAKQNYTMLDNLKLGYGGTKTEMERLLTDAQKLSGVKYDVSNLSDVYSAIHVIQENLGIAGTTAKEAEKTITGSANMTKAAWKNVLAAISGGGDLDKAINNLVYSISKYFDNIVPVVERSLAGIGRLIEEIAPQLVQTVATALIKAIPSLLNAVYQMLIGLAKGIYQGIVALFSGSSMTSEVSAQLNGVADAASAAADAEQDLADGITEASNAAKKSLAGFDELTVLQDNSDSTSGSSNSVSPDFSAVTDSGTSTFIEDLGKQSENTTGKINDLGSAIEHLVYETLGKIDLTSVYNFQNAALMVENSAKKFLDSFKLSTDSGGITDYFARKIEADALVLTAIMTAYSGWLDMQTGVTLGDGQEWWEGLGRIWGASGQVVTGYLESWGIENFFGFEVEEMREAFFPIVEEIPNLFRGVTTEQAKALKKLNTSFKKFQNNLSRISWADAIITKEEMKTLTDSFDEVLSEVSDHAAQSKEKAIDNINELVSKGFMTEDEAKEALDTLEGMYSKQEELLTKSKAAINEILQKAKAENRALTEDEKTTITKLTKAAQEEIISVVKVGAGDRTRILEELNATETGLSKVRLSQIIQFANDEYNAQVDAAHATYEDTIAEADKLYHELGIISEEQYNTVVESAKSQRDDQIRAASEAKAELVAKAQQTAGEVADAVDPETGEILSNWEVLWNSMLEKVTETWAGITTKCKEFINRILGYINGMVYSTGAGINGVVSALNQLSFTIPDWIPEYGGERFGFHLKSVSVPQIPYLAQGAVLPPNKPFMAVVGDQKHGTNIEAPLATIQEAVALVMQEQMDGMMAGFEAVVQAIRDKDSNVVLDGTVIAKSVNQYNRKMRIARGGL